MSSSRAKLAFPATNCIARDSRLVQDPRVVLDVLLNKRGDEEVAVIVAFLLPVHERQLC